MTNYSENGTIDVLNDDESLPLTSSSIETSVKLLIRGSPKVSKFDTLMEMTKNKKLKNQIFRGCIAIMAVYLLTTQSSTNATYNVNGVVLKSQEGPQVAWLMAFPNSGTTFTEKLIQKVTNKVLATNYGHEHFNQNGDEERISLSTPLFHGEEGMNGPFRLNDKALPKSGYILTKTHCAGYCFSDCPPNWYVVNQEKFQSECSRGARYIPSDNAPEEQIWVQYDPNIVKKVIHLYRNPFENIVGRFHHERRNNVLQGNHAWVNQYPDNESGFKAWCRDADERFSPAIAFNSEKTSFDNSFLDVAMKSPCYAEIIKFTQWHNHAHSVVENMGLPSITIHIEDFGTDFDRTLQSILNFIELPRYGDPIQYNFNSYKSYFSKDERTRMASFMKYLSSPVTWDSLGQYVDDLNLHDIQINHAIADLNEGNVETPHLPIETPKVSKNVPKSVSPGPQDNPVNGYQREPIVLPPDPPNKPQIAWLMSFPNSGTTYTEKLVQAVTDATVATNYGHEFVNAKNEEERLTDSLPVFSGKLKMNGPFRLSAKALPDGGYLLTKTHCGGYCFSDCPPNWYIYTPDMFLGECLKGARYSTENGGNGNEQIWVKYNQEIVKRAVHLFRDPYDNVISRFNHEHKTNKRQKNSEWLEHYPRNEVGFKKWCSDASNRVTPSDTYHSEMTTFDEKFLDVVDRVPCFAEFIKYTQWHNNAFAVARILGLDTLVVYYEDYRDNFDKTLDELLKFVELPKKGEPPKFGMASYDNYFTNDERKRIQNFIEYLSTPRTWEALSEKYFKESKSKSKSNQVKVQTGPDGRKLPEIAWLMSFPNSGTTYTEKLVQMLTQYTVATNYGHEYVNAVGQADRINESVPVFENNLDGPFRLSDAPLPDGGYLLTKTHCGGYCFSDCPPNWYILTPDQYLTECVRGARYSKKASGGGTEQTWVQYDPTIVKKIVHLIRDPFDNIIARFHHEYKISDREGKKEFTTQFSNDINGFKKWCQHISQKIKPSDTYHSEKTNFAPEFLEVSKNVPCYGEFIKYIQWHNNAFAVQKQLNVPGLVIKYEDYHFDFDGSVSKILNFVEQSSKGKAPEYLWHPYSGYYTEDEMRRIAKFLRFLSSDETLDVLNKEYLLQRNL